MKLHFVVPLEEITGYSVKSESFRVARIMLTPRVPCRQAGLYGSGSIAVAQRKHLLELAAVRTLLGYLLAAKVKSPPSIDTHFSHSPLQNRDSAVAKAPDSTIRHQILNEDLLGIERDKLSEVG